MHTQAIAKGIPLVVDVVTAKATAMPAVMIVIVFCRM
jgi:hypothetical protein